LEEKEKKTKKKREINDNGEEPEKRKK